MPTFYSRTFITTVAGTLTYTIGWPYLDTSHVKVKIDGDEVTVASVTSNQVTLSADPGSGGAMMVYRETPLSTIFSFTKLGTPSSGGFNTVFQTVQYITQEAADSLIGGAIILESEDVYSASSKRITDVADGSENSDAVNYAQLVAMAGSSGLLASLTGLGGYFTRVNIAETALEGRTATQTRSDLSLGDLATLNTVDTAEIEDAAITSAKIEDGAVVTSKFGALSVDTAAIANSAVTPAKLSFTPTFSEVYTSSGQTITAAGSLVLAHGLSGMPKLIVAYLKCTTTNLNYSVGDEVMVNVHYNERNAAGAQGISVVPDDTNLNVRYGDQANVFALINKTTGASADITTSSWQLYLRAFY